MLKDVLYLGMLYKGNCNINLITNAVVVKENSENCLGTYSTKKIIVF